MPQNPQPSQQFLFYFFSDPDDISENAKWNSQNCTISFETLGIWPSIADGTDINACSFYNLSETSGGKYSYDILAVGDDFGRVRLYR